MGAVAVSGGARAGSLGRREAGGHGLLCPVVVGRWPRAGQLIGWEPCQSLSSSSPPPGIWQQALSGAAGSAGPGAPRSRRVPPGPVGAEPGPWPSLGKGWRG